jgi:hypothetical protein
MKTDEGAILTRNDNMPPSSSVEEPNAVETQDIASLRMMEGVTLFHTIPEPLTGKEMSKVFHRKIYSYSDFFTLQLEAPPKSTYIHSLGSIDELLERDLQREKDGFPRKIRIGKLIKPAQGGKEKIVIVPTTVEEKFLHDTRTQDPDEEQNSGGSGDGDEGSIIGEEPVHASGGSGTGGAGQGEGAEHEIESSAYDLGRILTKKFELPNLKEKGKKRSLKRFTYELTDRHKGFGQILDKKATLRKIIETNINLERIPDVTDIDLTNMLVSPEDSIYRILSREKDFESQALVFFIRDYSGSMTGIPTELVVTQHVLIYSWLLYQYERQVETRFILHDTEAKEVPDFYAYHSMTVAGGTRVRSAYKLVNDIVETHSLARDYNIYIFHGTDGDDWDMEGEETIPEIRKMLTYSSRVGITITQEASGGNGTSTLEKCIRKSGILDNQPKLIKLDTVQGDANEARLIEGIKKLIS